MYGARHVKGEEYGFCGFESVLLEKVDPGMVDDLTKVAAKNT